MLKAEYLGFYNISEYKDADLEFNLTLPSSILILKKENKTLFYNPQEEGVEITFIMPVSRKFLLPSKKWIDITTSGMTEIQEKIDLF